MFPPQPGAGGLSSILDGPPPNPAAPSPMGLGVTMSPGGAPPSKSLGPEQVMGLLSTGSTVGDMLDTMARMVPDIAPELAGAKDLLQRGLAKLMAAGGGVTPPTSPGMVPGSAPFPPGSGPSLG